MSLDAAQAPSLLSAGVAAAVMQQLGGAVADVAPHRRGSVLLQLHARGFSACADAVLLARMGGQALQCYVLEPDADDEVARMERADAHDDCSTGHGPRHDPHGVRAGTSSAAGVGGAPPPVTVPQRDAGLIDVLQIDVAMDPAMRPCGLLCIEARAGLALSNWLPLVVVEEHDVADELNRFSTDCESASARARTRGWPLTFLTDLGVLLDDLLYAQRAAEAGGRARHPVPAPAAASMSAAGGGPSPPPATSVAAPPGQHDQQAASEVSALAARAAGSGSGAAAGPEAGAASASSSMMHSSESYANSWGSDPVLASASCVRVQATTPGAASEGGLPPAAAAAAIDQPVAATAEALRVAGGAHTGPDLMWRGQAEGAPARRVSGDGASGGVGGAAPLVLPARVVPQALRLICFCAERYVVHVHMHACMLV